MTCELGIQGICKQFWLFFFAIVNEVDTNKYCPSILLRPKRSPRVALASVLSPYFYFGYLLFLTCWLTFSFFVYVDYTLFLFVLVMSKLFQSSQGDHLTAKDQTPVLGHVLQHIRHI